MVILITLILFHLFVVAMGKYVKKVNYLSYLFIGIITSLQVLVVFYLLYTMEVPTP